MPEIELRVLTSYDSLSVPMWKEALEHVREIGPLAEHVLFVARDEGSLLGLRKHHGSEAMSSTLTAIPPEKARLFFDLGMKFRFAYLIDPTDEIIEGIKPNVTQELTITRRIKKPRRLL